MIFLILAVIAVMFIVQTFFGYWQVKNFNKNYGEMKSQNRVAIGRAKGLITNGVVLLIRIDRQAVIQEVRKMQGTTVFARFKKMDALNGKHLLKLEEGSVPKLDKFTWKALKDAQHVYKVVQAGGEPAQPTSIFQKITGLFKKKGEVNN
ncbi:transcriptional regulator GutM [Salimicrobium album]|uniref:DNA-binding transcriptional regulator of glucitol operon n=1 Tax=Salimicrobium album TaxID=50717 RepID=A0A1H3IP88_9BACI|nr:transcriptional regulator GutM [Salimicrobium album]SDY29079.1 DNA-binding transcriptional regulator of glucitol operon [Salimicrobium album]